MTIPVAIPCCVHCIKCQFVYVTHPDFCAEGCNDQEIAAYYNKCQAANND